ncbi:alpha-ketoglutarate-dependent dioxygenase alkB homolog 7, mitochondrial-like Protein [Elysia marginata]|uniref:Alpha-ketoglutarate-dependent dioxygenase alkB homolog 7, mitochondrial-like Protein n=1 Tax=Elysia marginata TaxID=1093978 RepID=A0AAV4EBK5_9GAST|nr:alpha-ketoglutarate-dependent dioxygenase alkB homolog 7, mitochondrial-like Protein [Elysia marginata]
MACKYGKLSSCLRSNLVSISGLQQAVTGMKRLCFSTYSGFASSHQKADDVHGLVKKLYNSRRLCLIKRNTDTAGFNRCYSTVKEQNWDSKDYLDAKDNRSREILANDMIVKTDFISEREEELLFKEVEKYMRRLRYEFDHWDNAIHGYRETEKREWNEENTQILERVKSLAFTSEVAPLAYVHVLDIAKEGYIKPHVDAVRFCGDTITGMCLLSSCVMRLALESDSTKYGDVFLPRRSLYIMRGKARYKFTHEVLKDEQSYFKNQYVPRDRRISIICRNEPAISLN